ncbi:GntR family transcriptional regulator [Weissella paramesenteroides]|uniref:GntR family transcriptional regulator n=1 Tax=Weissella paramesenteroides TaxID=1249 RepID=UPI0023A94AC7|nr:GntR family transcriptional regulator [Weissella paramesenteroides]WEA53658.1 GntR family transcriptional regulator [Weissella paramesenteroides]
MLKYQQIAKQIFSYIQDSHLKQGDQLPSLTELVTDYKASKITIQKAIAELEKEGFIYQVQGSGTFVRSMPTDDYINFNLSNGWTSDFTKKPTENSNINVQKISPSWAVAQKLNCAVDTPVFKVQRTKSINNKVFCFETSYYNSKLVPYLNDSIAQQSLFNYIKLAYNITISFTDKYFNVRELTSLESEKLGFPEKNFGLSVHETFYTTSGEVFDYSENVYHPDNAKFYL